MKPQAILIPFILFATNAECGGDRDAGSRARPFLLTISEQRSDQRDSRQMGESAPVNLEAELSLYGRMEVSAAGPGDAVTFYADSLIYHSRQPYTFRTFMSADTMYYAAGGGTADRGSDASIDSMLACLFSGPALGVFYSESGAPDSTVHWNDRCPSGEYGRINVPVTLGALLTRRLGTRTRDAGEHPRWRELRPVPSFSGVGFHPEIEFLYRASRVSKLDATITVAADSTIVDLAATMRNGEEVIITRDRVRVGGTLVVDRATGVPIRGELRIREALELARPSASGQVIRKDGEYSIRFSLR